MRPVYFWMGDPFIFGRVAFTFRPVYFWTGRMWITLRECSYPLINELVVEQVLEGIPSEHLIGLAGKEPFPHQDFQAINHHGTAIHAVHLIDPLLIAHEDKEIVASSSLIIGPVFHDREYEGFAIRRGSGTLLSWFFIRDLSAEREVIFSELHIIHIGFVFDNALVAHAAASLPTIMMWTGVRILPNLSACVILHTGVLECFVFIAISQDV